MAGKSPVEIKINTKEIENRLETSISKTQKVLDAQVLKDSNFYCPLESSMLQKSAILHSKLGSGWLIWKTPYAVEQYYGKPNKSHQKNPNATMKWFEAAKSKNINLWEKIIHGEFSQNFNKSH